MNTKLHDCLVGLLIFSLHSIRTETDARNRIIKEMRQVAKGTGLLTISHPFSFRLLALSLPVPDDQQSLNCAGLPPFLRRGESGRAAW